MRRRRSFNSIDFHDGKRPYVYPRALAALWLHRLMCHHLPLTDEVIEVAVWCLPNVSNIAHVLKEPLAQCARMRLSERQMGELQELQAADCGTLASNIGDFLHTAPPAVYRAVRQALGDALGRVPLRTDKYFVRAQHILTEFFSIPLLAYQICEFVYCVHTFTPIEQLFEDHLNMTSSKGGKLLAQALDAPIAHITKALCHLREMGIVDTDHRYALENNLEELWLTPNTKELERKFFGPLPREIYPLDEFPIATAERVYIEKLLRMRGKRPVHILLYGEPGTGKSSFAASLAASMGMKIWASPPCEDDKQQNRRASIQACSIMARNANAHGQPFLVVVDEADKVLAVRSFFGETAQNKAWLNTYLEQDGTKAIWITNDVHAMDESVARRFAYSVHFPALGVKERGTQWRRILENAHMEKKVDAPDVEALARDFSVPMGIMAHSVERCKSLYGRTPKKFLAGVRQSCEAFNKLCHSGIIEKTKKDTKPVANYNPAAVCLEGSSVAALLDRMKAADVHIRGGGTAHKGACTFLFYGPPGTGKTALARYLAEQLGRECDVVQASTWLDKYVGGTEQQIAQSFRQAQERGAVLVIDEADTFAFARDTAVRSWESSMINEFLTNLEDFTGFCICTTNRKGELDKAALRRFTFKVAFDWMTEDAALALYADTLAPLVKNAENTPLSDTQKQSLCRLARQRPGLAAGDFRVVSAAYYFAPPEECNHTHFIHALSEELTHKKPDACSVVGFGKRQSLV